MSCKGKKCTSCCCYHTLQYHEDVTKDTPDCNDVLIYNCVSGHWAPGKIDLSDLEGIDIDYDSLVTGDSYYFQWDGEKFVVVSATFAGLNDVDLTGLSSGDLVKWDGTNWVPYSVADLSDDVLPNLVEELSLDDLSNVSTADSAATGSVLVKTAGDWGATSPSSFASSIYLTDLGDVSITGASSGEVLRFNGTAWTDATLSTNDISNGSGVTGSTATNALNNLNGRVSALESTPPPSGDYRGTTVVAESTSTGNISFDSLADGGTTNTEGSNIWSAGQPTRLTVPAGISYIRLNYHAHITAGGSPVAASMHVRKNGSGTAFSGSESNVDVAASSNGDVSVATRPLYVTPGDYFTLYCNTGVYRAFFEMEILR